MKFYTEIITPYGTFTGEMLEGTVQQYNGLLEVTKHFYEQDVYWTYLEDGSFFAMGKELMKDSVVLIKLSEDEDEEN